MSRETRIVQPDWEVVRAFSKKDRQEFRELIKDLRGWPRWKAGLRFWLWGAPNHRVWFSKTEI